MGGRGGGRISCQQTLERVGNVATSSRIYAHCHLMQMFALLLKWGAGFLPVGLCQTVQILA